MRTEHVVKGELGRARDLVARRVRLRQSPLRPSEFGSPVPGNEWP